MADVPQEPCPCPSNAAIPTILVVPIEVNECWAIDMHWQGAARTPMGELVHDAKTYGAKLGSLDAANRLANCLAWWAEHLARVVPASRMQDVDVVCSVPANPPKQPYNLADVLAEAVAARLGTPFRTDLLRKLHPTAEVKFTTDKRAKLEVLVGAFGVDADVADKVVLVVDDLVLSGATLETIGAHLREAGARRVLALAATRATKGLTPA